MRHFENWLNSYFEYSRDGFVPDKFHYWTGISMLAATLERKVWLPWNPAFTVYPNLYVLLVAKPGIGKSTAISKGINLILEMKHQDLGNVKTVPSQVTEAKLLEIMSHVDYFTYKDAQVPHCSGFFYASEASQCLKDITGSSGLVPTITHLFDCDPLFEKATIAMKGQTQRLVNICFNLIAGSTFDYLEKLITNRESLRGGFASRLNYVIQREFWERKVSFQDRNRNAAVNLSATKQQLIEDLGQINQMTGPFRADSIYAEAWEDWFKNFDTEFQNHPSANMQSLLTRKHTMLNKLPMILSASESDERILKLHHFEKSLELVEELEKDLPYMLQEGKAQSTDSQDGINNALTLMLEKSSGKKIPYRKLVTNLVCKGFDKGLIERTIEALNGGPIKMSGNDVELVEDTQNYL